MRISLIIPAYNEEKYIGACLESVVQNASGILHEIIVINNASTDKTQKIAQSFPGVRVVSEMEKGLTKARQRGLVEASGDILAFIDADTRMPKGWAEKMRSAFEKNEWTVCASGPYVYHDVSKITKHGVKLYWHLASIIYRVTGYLAVGGNFAAKKSALLSIGGFDTTINFYGEDTDIARRLHKVGKVHFSHKLYILTSGRRFAGEGIFMTASRYMRNFFSVVIGGKPVTKEYTDIR